MIIITFIKKYIWPIIIGAAAIGGLILRSMFINQGRQAERAKANDAAIKSTKDAQEIRNNVDQGTDAIRNDPDNRRNSGV